MSSDTTATDKRRGERDGGKKKEEEEEEEDKYKTNKTKEKSNHQSYLQLTLRPGLALVHTLCKVSNIPRESTKLAVDHCHTSNWA